MQANLVSCLFILDSEKNRNIRKNDIKKPPCNPSQEGLFSVDAASLPRPGST